MLSARSLIFASVVLGLAMAGPSQAQTLEEKLRAQLRAALDQLHALQNSQTALEAAKSAAEQERDALKAKLASAGAPRTPPKPAPETPAEVQKLRDDATRLAKAKDDAEAELGRFRTAYAQVVSGTQQLQAERDRKVQEADAATQTLTACETKNIELVKIGRDVLAAYTKIGVKDALAKGEPMIGLKRLAMERIAQDYGDKVYAAKFDPRAVKTSASKSPAAASQPAAAPAPASGQAAAPAAPPAADAPPSR
jgi:hypothetical protein